MQTVFTTETCQYMYIHAIIIKLVILKVPVHILYLFKCLVVFLPLVILGKLNYSSLFDKRC